MEVAGLGGVGGVRQVRHVPRPHPARGDALSPHQEPLDTVTLNTAAPEQYYKSSYLECPPAAQRDAQVGVGGDEVAVQHELRGRVAGLRREPVARRGVGLRGGAGGERGAARE